MMMYLPWTLSEIRLLKQQYELNPYVYDLFQYRTKSSINHKASKLHIKKINRIRKYSINYYFFRNWNSNMAYILGFFYSDGNVSSNKRCISIHLKVSDHYILEKISNVMSSNRPVKIYSCSSYLRLDSKILVNDLIKLGCTPKKSKTLIFPNIKNKYLSHFVRGYFDGDGSIHFNKPNTIKLSFIGTRRFLVTLQMRIGQLLGLRSNPLSKVKSIWRFHYYGDDARRVCNWMYSNTKDLYLKRKKERYDNHIRLRKDKIR